MITNVATLKTYSAVGKILAKTKPDIFSQISSMMSTAAVTNIDLIFGFHEKFQSFLPSDKPIDQRRIFIAAMLKLYHPWMMDSNVQSIQYGFARNISQCFGCKQPGISRDIREVVVLYKAYEDFREKVNQVYEFLKPQQQ